MNDSSYDFRKFERRPSLGVGVGHKLHTLPPSGCPPPRQEATNKQASFCPEHQLDQRLTTIIVTVKQTDKEGINPIEYLYYSLTDHNNDGRKSHRSIVAR